MELRHDHTAVCVKDYDEALRWYVDKLDFTVGEEWPVGEMRLAYLTNGTSKVEIIGVADASPSQRADDFEGSFGMAGYHHICFAVNSVDETVAELRGRDVPIIVDPFDVPEINKRLAFLKDVSGNMIELSQAL